MTQSPQWQQDPAQQPAGHEPYPPASRMSPEDERNWAMAAHLGSFLAAYVALGVIAPLIVLLVKGNDSAFVRRHAVESLNFQLNALVYTVVFALLILVLVGLVLLPLYAIFYLVVVILGAVRASNGEDYRYPATIRFVS